MDYREWLNQNRDDLPDEIERKEEETDDQFLGFNHYLLLGRKRTLRRAYYNYSIDKGNITREETSYSSDLRVGKNFKSWSSSYKWIERARALDDWISAKNLHQLIERQDVVESNSWADYQMLRQRIIDSLIVQEEGTLSPRELKELGMALKYADEIGRKTAGLPSTITQSAVARERELNSRAQEVSVDELEAIHSKAEGELNEWNKERRDRSRENSDRVEEV